MENVNESVMDSMHRKQDDKEILHIRYATTSAALKLLLLRLTGRGPGRCVFEAGMTTADAPVVIHASDVALALPPAAISASEFDTFC